MKKPASIFLIFLFLFNLVGYRIIYFYEQQQSDAQLEKSLDKDLYNNAELLTLKVSLSLPYLSANTQFERVDGEIKVDGKIYRYVKRRISEGQLVLLCLPDYNKMRLQYEANESYKNTNDLAASSSSHKTDNSKAGVFKNILSDYTKSENDHIAINQVNLITHASPNDLSALTHFSLRTVEQPPERV